MIYLSQRRLHRSKRGDAVKAVELSGRRVILSRPVSHASADRKARGFTLIELVITITVMTILTMGVVPLLKMSVKRQKEQQLHDTLRQLRTAIDEFHRDTMGMNCSGTALTGNTGGPVPPVDPRSKVVISDCTIFGVDNPDRYPPDLETLVKGVNVIPRGGAGTTGGQGLQSTGTATTNTTSVLGSEASTKTKVYLRAIPVDPMTGQPDWDIRSCYDAAGAESWGGENVFDVRSKSKDKALNGDKYSDW